MFDGVPCGGGVTASMKGFPRRGSDAFSFPRFSRVAKASMKGFPRRGSDVSQEAAEPARAFRPQ